MEIDWVKIGLLLFCLLLPLIFNLEINKKILYKKKKYIFFYSIIWLSLAIVALVAQFYPEENQILVIFYLSISFCISHLVVSMLSAEDYRESCKFHKKAAETCQSNCKLLEQEVKRCEETCKLLEQTIEEYRNRCISFEHIPGFLAILDIYLVKCLCNCEHMNQEEISYFFKQRSDGFIKRNIFTEATRKDYDMGIDNFIESEYRNK